MSNADKPAFPNDGMLPEGAFGWMNGLTKRELVAAMAMQGLLAKGEQKKGELLPGLLAADAVDYANALLSELEKTPPPDAK